MALAGHREAMAVVESWQTMVFLAPSHRVAPAVIEWP
jgi:hypothetical protein